MIKTLQPGQTIGILGAGQLGRMLATAAAQLGFSTRTFAPDKEPPAAQVATGHINADFTETAALRAFAQLCDVVTYEFENIPLSALKTIAADVPVYPDPRCLEIGQDRLLEKDFLTSIGVKCPAYVALDSRAALAQAVSETATPCVLKTRRFGYDGKGQFIIKDDTMLDAAWNALGTAPGGLILEEFVNFEREISVIVARGADGDAKVYGPSWNTHSNHILHRSTVPCGIPADVAAVAISHAMDVAEALGAIGVICVEFFVGHDGSIYANEIAPRVHNSGHWTIEGATTSQFENHIRAISGLPLGTADALGHVWMQNLIGRDINDFQKYLGQPGIHLHHYGKTSVRVGRKMGHITGVNVPVPRADEG